MKTEISIVINTLNEGKNLSRCLNSIKWSDDIVVVDMYSVDNTINIANKYGARIYKHNPTKYVEPARNYAITKAKNEWVLVIDADETIPSSLKNKLLEIIQTDKDITHILIPRKNIVLGKWLKHCGEWANHQTRLFKKSAANWTSHIHKQPIVKGNEFRLPAKEEYAIIHHYYNNISEFVSKFDIYTTYHAKRITRKTTYRFKTRHLITRPVGEFVKRYIISKGFLDGIEGFIHCILMTFYYFLIYVKIWKNRL